MARKPTATKRTPARKTAGQQAGESISERARQAAATFAPTLSAADHMAAHFTTLRANGVPSAEATSLTSQWFSVREMSAAYAADLEKRRLAELAAKQTP